MECSRLEKNVCWAVADFETITQESEAYKRDGHTGVALAHIIIFNQPKIDENGKQIFTYDVREERDFFSLDDFMEYLSNLKMSMPVYFHNSNWDCDFIWKWFLRNPKYKNNIVFRGQNEVEFKKSGKTRILRFNNGNNIYYIDWRRKDWRGNVYTIRFQCSLKLLSSSIAELGKSLGMEKHDEFDYRKLDLLGLIKYKTKDDVINFYNALDYKEYCNELIMDVFIKYCKSDTVIQSKALILFFNFVVDLPWYATQYGEHEKYRNVFNFVTVGSIVRKLHKNFVREYDRKYGTKILKGMSVGSEGLFDYTGRFFRGGFTQFNDEFQIREFEAMIAVFDINSSYPFQMTKLLPYGELLDEKPEGEYLEWVIFKAKKCEIKTKYENWPIMPACFAEKLPKCVDRYIKAGRNVEGYALKQEFDWFMKVYKFKRLKFTIKYTKAARYLKDYYEYLFKERAKHKKEGRSGLAQMLKIKMNSGYGSTSMKGNYPIVLHLTSEEKTSLKGLKKGDTFEYKGREYKFDSNVTSEDWEDKDSFQRIRVFDLTEIKEHWNNLLVPAAITSYARCQLWDLMDKIGFKRCIYTDTDSVFFIMYDKGERKFKDSDEALKVYLEEHPDIKQLINDDLGGWKPEATADRGYINGAKRYSFTKNGEEVKSAIAGVNQIVANELVKDVLIRGMVENGKRSVKSDAWGKYLATSLRGPFPLGQGHYGVIVVFLS